MDNQFYDYHTLLPNQALRCTGSHHAPYIGAIATTLELCLARTPGLAAAHPLPDRPCSVVSEPIGGIPDRVDYYTQQSALKQTKILFPEYKDIWAESQQVNLQRLKKAWERWMIPDVSGKRGGRPKFKKQGELRSFVYPRVNDKRAGAHLKDGVLKLSKIGSMTIIMHRPIPDGFTLKTCTIVRKADGWYCCLSMQDETYRLLCH